MREKAASIWRIWTGRALTAVVVLFLVMDTSMKLMDLPAVRQTMAPLGWPAALGRPIGVIELVCLALYAVPRTAVLGAVLLTGLMGAAVATHWRVGDPLFSHVLFGVYLGVMAWAGLWLREPRLRDLLPMVRSAAHLVRSSETPTGERP